MRNGWLIITVFFVVGLLPALGRADDRKDWELRGRDWQEVQTPSTQPIEEPLLDQVQSLLEHKQYKSAKSLALYWVKLNKASPVRDRGLFLLGVANFYYGDRIQSFYEFDELMDNYVGGRYFGASLQWQYDIAEAFLRGYKERFLKIPVFGAEARGVEMLYRIQQRAPGSPLAEKSLIRTCDYYYNTGQYDLASDAYGAFVRGYPRSPEAPRARLQQAFSNLAQFRGLKYDATPIVDGREQLTEIETRDPQMAQDRNLPAIIDRIDDTFARKIFVTADFYRRTHQPAAAIYNYRFLIATYPQAPEATRARAELAKFSAKLLAAPQPPVGEGYSPATAPAVETP